MLDNFRFLKKQICHYAIEFISEKCPNLYNCTVHKALFKKTVSSDKGHEVITLIKC
jgi:hypothetical protein